MAGQVHEEIEPGLVTSAPILWGDHGLDSGMLEAAELDDRQRALASAIRGEHRADLEQVLAAILAQRIKRHVVPLYVQGAAVVNQEGNQRVLNAMPGSGQWILEQVVAWADPAASANLQVNLSVGDAIAIPIPLALSRVGIASTPIELPVATGTRVSWATSGGLAADRGVVLLIFKREG